VTYRPSEVARFARVGTGRPPRDRRATVRRDRERPVDDLELLHVEHVPRFSVAAGRMGEVEIGFLVRVRRLVREVALEGGLERWDG
jgi:hypothetical protein